jgi:hypothetical protein
MMRIDAGLFGRLLFGPVTEMLEHPDLQFRPILAYMLKTNVRQKIK